MNFSPEGRFHRLERGELCDSFVKLRFPLCSNYWGLTVLIVIAETSASLTELK